MRPYKVHIFRSALAILASCVSVDAHPATSATQPETKPAAVDSGTSVVAGDSRSARIQAYEELIAKYYDASRQFNAVLTPPSYSDATARTAAAPHAIPVINHMIELVDQIIALKVIPSSGLEGLRQTHMGMLYLLNDAPTVAKVNELKSSTNFEQQISGEAIALSAKQIAAGSDKDQNGKVIDELEKLDKAHPESLRLTQLTLDFAQWTRVAEQRPRIMSLATDVMNNSLTASLKKQLAAAKKQGEETPTRQNAFVNKPFILAARTVDGKDFDIGSMKGKVVLVDFWATWCGPCKAGLPHVKDIYGKYHKQGLEIVGISNDNDPQALIDFTAKNDMPWPQIFDAAAAAKGEWNPLSAQYGVNGIPCIFLIDKKGILRSVSARENMDDLIPKLLAEGN